MIWLVWLAIDLLILAVILWVFGLIIDLFQERLGFSPKIKPIVLALLFLVGLIVVLNHSYPGFLAGRGL